jgi:hypothetical protein
MAMRLMLGLVPGGRGSVTNNTPLSKRATTFVGSGA